MALYSFQGQYPTQIPFRIRLSSGLTRTDPSTFTSQEIADAGYIEVNDLPTVLDTQVVSWSEELIDWVVRNKTTEELQAEEDVIQNQRSNEITVHRDMLIANGFYFNGVKFDSRPEDQKRISGASLLAFMAIVQGAQPGNYTWHGGQDPFVWIANDNSLVAMDAYDVVEFGKAAAFHESSHVFAARMLKDMNPIPSNYTDPMYWPVVSSDGSSLNDGSSIV